MDKRFMKGRLALVALIAVLCIAIPAAAFAASSNTFPGSSTTTPGVVGVTFTGVSAASAQITIDGTARLTKMDKASSVSGSWVTEDVDAGAAVVIKWVWKPTTAADGQIKVYAFPTAADGQAAGPHAVVATIKDSKGVVVETASWSYTINQTIPAAQPEDGAEALTPQADCVVCHAASYATISGMGPDCNKCHSDLDAPKHGNPVGSNTEFWGGTASGHSTTLYGVNGGITEYGEEGVVVKNSLNDTITQEWPRPTTGVFWSQSSMVGTDSPLVAMANRGFASAAAGAAAVRTDVGWDTVITCQDCHTGMSAAGPQGANSGKAALDPNFPDDWKTASLTTWDPTGMRSVLTTAGTANPYYEKRWTGIDNTGVVRDTTTQNASYLFGDVTGRYICQKCHKLTNLKAGYPAQDRSGRSKPDMGVSNSAHMEHHPDQKFGQGNCVSCHVAIPHGWKRPRLLVYETDPTPFKGSQPTTATPVSTTSGVSGMGNWTYNNGKSTHIDAIWAGPYMAEPYAQGSGYFKELLNDTRGRTDYQYAGWDTSKYYVEWGAPGADQEGQPNCNACAATGTTHTYESNGGEGIPTTTSPVWK